jgi:F-type H+-transporting ATPase subunit alpha
LPAVDVGRSVSRVGGKAQLPAFRETAGDLRLAYSQFEELERFSRYGTRLEESQRRKLEHGRRVREVLKQPQGEPLSVAEQVAVLYAAKEGAFENVPVDEVPAATDHLRETVRREMDGFAQRVSSGEELTDDDRDALLSAAKDAASSVTEGSDSDEPQSGQSEGEYADD